MNWSNQREGSYETEPRCSFYEQFLHSVQIKPCRANVTFSVSHFRGAGEIIYET